MFCSGCGSALAQGQPVCAQCGRPVAPVVPPVPGMQFELENYAGKVKVLSLVWFIYAALSLVLAVAGMTFAHAFFTNHFGPWAHGQLWADGSGPPEWLGQAFLRFIWVLVIVRSGLAFVAGWGLHERTQWGRIVAIVVAFLNLLKFPVGTVLGIWTLVILMGYRNSTLYDRLGWNPQTGGNY